MTSAPPVRVLIADDDPLVRAGLALMLDGHDRLAVCGQAANGAEALASAQAAGIDVILMDIRMPVMDGIDAVAAICRLPAAPAVIMLTTFTDDELVLTALDAGAAGFIVKDSPPHDIVRAIHAVAAGDAVLSPSVTRTVLANLRGGQQAPATVRAQARDRLAALTPREFEVATRIGQGDTNADIATRLYMSLSTVKAHITASWKRPAPPTASRSRCSCTPQPSPHRPAPGRPARQAPDTAATVRQQRPLRINRLRMLHESSSQAYRDRGTIQRKNNDWAGFRSDNSGPLCLLGGGGPGPLPWDRLPGVFIPQLE